MRNKKIIPGALAIALLLPVAAAGKDEDAGQKMICKHKQQTGTRFKIRTCMTAAQWEEMAENNRANLKEMVDRPQIEIRK